MGFATHWRPWPRVAPAEREWLAVGQHGLATARDIDEAEPLTRPQAPPNRFSRLPIPGRPSGFARVCLVPTSPGRSTGRKSINTARSADRRSSPHKASLY